MSARQRFGDEVRLVPSVQLVAQVFDVSFDGARSYAELLGALLRRKTISDALENLAFSLRKDDEIFLLS